MKNPMKFQRIGFWRNSQPWDVKAFIKYIKGSLPVLWNQYLSIINKRKREIEINQTINNFRDRKYLSCELKENHWSHKSILCFSISFSQPSYAWLWSWKGRKRVWEVFGGSFPHLPITYIKNLEERMKEINKSKVYRRKKEESKRSYLSTQSLPSLQSTHPPLLYSNRLIYHHRRPKKAIGNHGLLSRSKNSLDTEKERK